MSCDGGQTRNLHHSRKWGLCHWLQEGAPVGKELKLACKRALKGRREQVQTKVPPGGHTAALGPTEIPQGKGDTHSGCKNMYWSCLEKQQQRLGTTHLPVKPPHCHSLQSLLFKNK